MIVRATYPHRLRRLKRAALCELVRRYPALQPLLPAIAPLNVLRFGEPRHSELMVFLPGLGDVAEDFERNGFVQALRDSARPADMAVADIHFGYYVRRSVLERLRVDVIEPAKSCGYATIFLIGISLGGLGALLYAMEHPADVQGLMLLAPYLGDASLAKEIEDTGGLKLWDAGDVDVDDHPRKLWRWLKQCALSPGKCELPETYLGFGDRDPFAPGNALLGDILPEHRVFTVRGGHDWQTWERLWRMFLAQRDVQLQAG
jgi:pimeloyl-ACP methyl ester carboxylesterase